MRIKFEANRRLTIEEFRILQDRPIFFTVLKNRISVFLPHPYRDHDRPLLANIEKLVDDWLMENAMGCFHVKIETRDKARVDIYCVDPNDAFAVKLRLENESVYDW